MANEKEEAVELLRSARGSYIIGQALYIAVKEMEKRPDEGREYSNKEDMRLMMEQLFHGYYQSELALAKFRRKIK